MAKDPKDKPKGKKMILYMTRLLVTKKSYPLNSMGCDTRSHARDF